MKKLIIFLLAAVLLCGAFASAEEFTVQPNPPKGINYSYKYATLIFKAGESMSWMDKYIHMMAAPAEAADGDVYVLLDELKAMYAPDFTVEEAADQLTLNHFGLTVTLNPDSADAVIDGHAYTFKNAPKTVDGKVMVPAMELCSVGFGTPAKELGNGFYAVSYSTAEITGRFDTNLYNGMIRGKNVGFVYLTYTIPDDPDQKILPLRLYVPSNYDPEKPMRAIVLLHGNSVSMNYFYPDTQEAIKQYRGIETFAEEYGYILISGTAYLVGGGYGDVDGMPFQDQTEWRNLSEYDKELRMRSEKSVLSLMELAFERYNVDMDHLYLMGNSMGGVGTLFLGNKHADMFDAIVPCAIMPNFSLIDGNPFPNLVDKPILCCVGTEDSYGYDLYLANYKILESYVNDIRFYAAAGGVHNTGWCISLPVIFDFLNAQY
ncbi:MAG: hypothetical protein IJJ80_01800 [Clostridia bacterium]|nr:hypothetical protein [Clostridia bacterium]